MFMSDDDGAWVTVLICLVEKGAKSKGRFTFPPSPTVMRFGNDRKSKITDANGRNEFRWLGAP